ncbi:MAG: HAMP domain-containing sensor histidine kinase, partial [Myxococcota bacterium]|nr:HAMP domain-containing sensor histidine kinase [Myxococcota bacterium]
MVGSALQLAIMAVAMSERMNWLREDLERQRHRLEEQVDERRLELAKAHANLTKSQKQLAQSERMAALGDMVAGIAHEINTPIGIGITASSRMDEVIRDLENHLAQNTLKKSSLVGGLQTLREAEDIILNNLQRAAELIMSFKQVSADQASGTMRTFDLGLYTRDILRGLETKIKRSNVEVEQSIAEKIRIFGPAGAYAQLLTNLVQNSLLHGFHGREHGSIKVSAALEEGTVTWVYEDDGNGISKEQQERVFEPFYTTARERGGTGLGLSIIMNLVTGSFGGTMELTSEKNKGVRFEVRFPAQTAMSSDPMHTAVLTAEN